MLRLKVEMGVVIMEVGRWRWKDCLFKALLNCLRPCPKNKQKGLKGCNGKCTFMPICSFLWSPPVTACQASVLESCLAGTQEAARMSSHAPSPPGGQCGQVSWKWSLVTVFLLFVFDGPVTLEPQACQSLPPSLTSTP